MTEKKISRVEKLKKEMKQEYLNCATLIFQEKGFNDTRVKDITDKAGTSVGNFYNYFKTKEDIFEELMKTFATFMIEEMKVLHEYDIPPIKVLKDLYHKYIDEFKDKAELALIYLEQMSGINEKFRLMKNKYDDEATSEMTKVIQKLLDLKVIPKQNPELTARIWLGGILETFRWWVHTGFEMDQEEVINQLANFLAVGTVKKRFT